MMNNVHVSWERITQQSTRVSLALRRNDVGLLPEKSIRGMSSARALKLRQTRVFDDSGDGVATTHGGGSEFATSPSSERRLTWTTTAGRKKVKLIVIKRSGLLYRSLCRWVRCYRHSCALRQFGHALHRSPHTGPDRVGTTVRSDLNEKNRRHRTGCVPRGFITLPFNDFSEKTFDVSTIYFHELNDFWYVVWFLGKLCIILYHITIL